MAKLVFGMNQSLDGYIDHMAFAPDATLFRHFIEEASRPGKLCRKVARLESVPVHTFTSDHDAHS